VVPTGRGRSGPFDISLAGGSEAGRGMAAIG